MRHISSKIVLALAAVVLVLFVFPVPVAFARSCSSVKSGNWSDPGTWNCNPVPTGSDTVTIQNGTVMLDVSSAVWSLVIDSTGVLRVSGSNSLTVTGRFGTMWNPDWKNDGAFDPGSGTVIFEGQFDGSYYEQFIGGSSTTTFHNVVVKTKPQVTANANLTLNGTLSGVSPATFHFNGSTFTNNGTVTIYNFGFYGSGLQTLAGDGSWTGDHLGFGSNVTRTGDPTFSATDVTVSINGTISGDRAFRTAGNVTLTQNGNFTSPLEVVTGTTTAITTGSGTTKYFDGTITIDRGATLLASNGQTEVRGNVNVNSGGTLGSNGSASFYFYGDSFTNNGTINAYAVDFFGTSPQFIAGTGSWRGNHVTLGAAGSSSIISLANDVTFGGPGVSTSVWVEERATITGGTLRTEGLVEFNQNGTFNAPFEVHSGTTTIPTYSYHPNAVFNGTVTIDHAAVLSIADGRYFISYANVSLGGTLSTNGCSYLRFNGPAVSLVDDATINGYDLINANTLSVGSHTLTFTGRYFQNNGTLSGGTGTIIFDGTTDMSTGGTLDLHNVTINGSLSVPDGSTLSVSGNWTNNGSFSPHGGTVVFDGTATPTQILTFSGTSSFNNLTVASSAIVETGSSTMNVAGAYVNDGQLRHSPTTPTSCPSGSQTDATGNTTVSFTACSGFTNAIVKSAAGGLFPNVTVGASLKYGDCPASANLVRRYWEITPTDGSGDRTARVTFAYRPSELNGNTALALHVWKCAGTIWIPQSGTPTYGESGGYNTVTLSNVSIGSGYGLSDDSPTAVRLSFFTARPVESPFTLAVLAGLGLLSAITVAGTIWRFSRRTG